MRLTIVAYAVLAGLGLREVEYSNAPPMADMAGLHRLSKLGGECIPRHPILGQVPLPPYAKKAIEQAALGQITADEFMALALAAGVPAATALCVYSALVEDT